MDSQGGLSRLSRPGLVPWSDPSHTVERVLWLRKQLADAGLDAGADTIGWHLAHHHATTLSRATINRILTHHNRSGGRT